MIKQALKRYMPGLFGAVYAAKERVRMGVHNGVSHVRLSYKRYREESAPIGRALYKVITRERQKRSRLNLHPGLIAVPPELIKKTIHSVRIKGYPHKLYYRDNISDLCVVEQIFCRGEYAGLPDMPDAKLIIDCGSNIGCSVIYFLERYPTATVVAIEPDDANFQLLLKNVKPYGNRVIAIKSGVWSSVTGLKVTFGGRDELAWSIKVREAAPGEKPDLDAVTIEEARRRAGIPVIDLLKLDIEGTERELFLGDHHTWLSHTKVLAIELHGKECTQTFEKGMSDYHFRSVQSGEYLICTDIARNAEVQGIARAVPSDAA